MHLKNHFSNTQLVIKNSKSEYIPILKEILKIFELHKPYELYEHLIIRAENRLRDYDKVKYEGVILSDKVSKFYNNLNILFRESLEFYVRDLKKKKINFDCIKPNESWNYLNQKKKLEFIKIHLDKYLESKNLHDANIQIIRLENKTDVFLSISNFTDIDFKNDLCLDIEVFFKKNHEESLCFYLETVIDKNKGRRLKV